MLFYADFKSIEETSYRVEIITNKSSERTTELTLNWDSPVIISQESSGIFSPIKSRSCSISILAKSVYPEFYTFRSQEVSVGVYPIVSGNPDRNNPLFVGYVSPGLYSQPYAEEWDYLEIECVDRLSTLKTIKYSCEDTDAKIRSLDYIIKRCLAIAGYPSTYTFSPTFFIGGPAGDEELFEKTYVSESNFFDDDAEQTPWTCYEVLEEICKYFGFTLIVDGASPKFIDYDYIKSQSRLSISKNDYYGTDSNVSYDDVYNKITISQNTYSFDELVPDINESSNCDSVTKEANLGSGACNWTHTKRSGILWWRKTETIKDGADWTTFAHAKPGTGWTHRFWNIQTGMELPNEFFDTSGNPLKPYGAGSTGLSRDINKAINTQCALVEKYTATTNTVKDPSSLSWDSLIMFQCLNDTQQGSVFNYAQKPVLTYKSKQEIQYSPTPGDKCWICFKGDLWYQAQNDDYHIYNIDKKFLCVAPTERILQPESYKYSYVYRIGSSVKIHIATETRTKTDTSWGKGWNCLTAQLKIGDKYWNGTAWTTTSSTFKINYNNAPDEDSEEHIIYSGWMSPISNFTYTDKVGDDCWAIPITSSDNLRGKLEFTLYTPNIFPGQEINVESSYRSMIPWYAVSPIVFLKNFSLKYRFTNQELWYLDIDGEEYTKDIAFSNTPEQGSYVIEDTSIKCRFTTFVNEDDCQSQLSRSHILIDGGYLQNLYNNNTTETMLPERQLVTKYYNHFSSKKLIYDTTLVGYRSPDKPYTITAINDNTKTFIIDDWQWDVHLNRNKITFMEV